MNADFSRRAAVHVAEARWTASPEPGVERLMLDRVGGEVARATSLVRYAPGSRFPAHAHARGEEFLVLEGVFQDEAGDYPAGTYVRNPPGSRHAPGSAPGCTIFVKLRQFAANDATAVRAAAETRAFLPVADRNVTRAPLFGNAHETVALERWAAGQTVRLAPAGGIEVLVLAGAFREGGEDFGRHDWLRLPAGAGLHATAGAAGAEVWVKLSTENGHFMGD